MRFSCSAKSDCVVQHGRGRGRLVPRRACSCVCECELSRAACACVAALVVAVCSLSCPRLCPALALADLLCRRPAGHALPSPHGAADPSPSETQRCTSALRKGNSLLAELYQRCVKAAAFLLGERTPAWPPKLALE